MREEKIWETLNLLRFVKLLITPALFVVLESGYTSVVHWSVICVSKENQTRKHLLVWIESSDL